MKRLISFVLIMIIAASTVVSVGAVEVGFENTAADIVAGAVRDEEESVSDEPAFTGLEAPTEPSTEATDEVPTEKAVERPIVDIPRITLISAVKGGVKISFSPFYGAYKYRVFYKGESGWKTIGDTFELSYTRKNVPYHIPVTYTVRAVGRDGKFCSAYDKEGYVFTYYPTPVLKSAASVLGGIKISWNAVSGAENYRTYVKDGASWKGIGNSASTSFVYKNAVPGAAYTFCVRVYDKYKKAPLSYYDTKGISVRYVDAPTITGFTPTDGGVKVNLTKPIGAASVRLFYKNGDSWKKIGDTTASSVSHTGLADGDQYVYTVRAMDSSNKYISGYDSEGWTYRYIAPVKISHIAAMGADIHLSWSSKANVAGYRVYRKSFGGGWKALADIRDTSYMDQNVDPDALYAYTLRCLDENNNAISYYIKDERYYIRGVPANGTFTVNGSPIRFADGYVRQGFITVDGKTYYYDSNGILQKDGVVGSKNEGYRYADKNGVIDMSFTGIAKGGNAYWYVKKGVVDMTVREAVSYGGNQWNVLNGKARKVVTEEDKVLYRALKLVAKVTDSSMTKEQKLKKMWDYIRGAYVEKNPRIPHYKGMDWPIIYANDMLINGVGNCMSYGAEFCYIAKALGYKDIYACHSGGHGWAEIEGLVYDPEWSRHRFKYNYYGLSYDAKTDQDYKSAIAPGYPWMHVKICADYED